MRVLVVCHRLPFPPNDGGRVRSFNIIRHLSEHHSVIVAVPTRSKAEQEAAMELRRYCQKILIAPISPMMAMARMALRLASPSPSSMGYFYSPDLHRQIRSVIASERFDLIIAVCSSVAPYVADVSSTFKLLDFVDMDSQKWLAFARVKPFPLAQGYWLEGVKLQRAETMLASKFDACTCITRAEMETLRHFGVEIPMDWFPNGVDLDFFAPESSHYRADSIAFIGRLDYFPNQQGVAWFCREILPLIRTTQPETTVTIVGAEPPPWIQALTEIPGVVVKGTVPDVRPYVRSAALTVVPLKIARGTQNKILESFALGVPVVATSIAANGVEAEPGEHLLVADSARDFAQAVSRLLSDPAERSRLADNGRTLVEQRYSWSAAMAKFDAMIAGWLDETGRTKKTSVCSLPHHHS